VAVEAVGHRLSPPGFLGRLGAGLLELLQVLGEATLLFLAALRAVPAALHDRARVGTQIVRVGTDTLWIGGLLALFVGMVLVVQTADQIENVGQDILGPIVGLAMTKELGPVLMAFLLAGRAGSAMAAELGSMTVYDEINALRTMDIDPVRFLVMPRFIAATITLPILVLYADFIGVGAPRVGSTQRSLPCVYAHVRWVCCDILIGTTRPRLGMVARSCPAPGPAPRRRRGDAPDHVGRGWAHPHPGATS
jgi:ABC-type transporter Mla maintaining outer membrane lipid asymmetry permease subunit MlaE